VDKTWGQGHAISQDQVNRDGTVTLYAITAQTSSISGGEPDPTKLVTITDVLAAPALPADGEQHHCGDLIATLMREVLNGS